MKIPRSIFTGVISVLLLAIFTEGVFAATADTGTSAATVQFTQPAGKLLRLDAVPSLDFGSHAASLTDQTYTALNDPVLTVTDEGSGATAWNVKVKATAFTNSNSDPLEGASITFTSGAVDQILGIVNAVLGLPHPQSPINLSTDGTAAGVVSAGDGLLPYGMGSWDTSWTKANVSLSVYGGTMQPASLYTSTLTWTLEDTPLN